MTQSSDSPIESTKELHESKERKPEMKWEDGKIFAPWTPEQVEALNAYQKGPMHPFTCGNDDKDAHRREGFDSWQEFEARRTLIATEAGWICPSCDYTQDWAHDFMGRVALPRGAEPELCPTCHNTRDADVPCSNGFHIAGLSPRGDDGTAKALKQEQKHEG